MQGLFGIFLDKQQAGVIQSRRQGLFALRLERISRVVFRISPSRFKILWRYIRDRILPPPKPMGDALIKHLYFDEAEVIRRRAAAKQELLEYYEPMRTSDPF